MTVSAMYPGTFDPITLGHEDFVRRAAKLYDKVVVAVAADTVELAQQVLADIDNVEVAGYEGLTIDFAQNNGLAVIVRGLRAISDFEYEFQLASMNRHLTQEVETAFLTPTDKFTFISSTLVREVATLGGDISEFVSPAVREALLQKVGRA